MGKVKVTLSVDDELLRESRAYLAQSNLTISGTLEDALAEIAASRLFGKIGEKLGGKLDYVGYEEVRRGRPKGRDAAKAVRGLRDARAEAVSR